MGTLSTIIAVLFLALAALVIYGTIAKNRWGFNFQRASCPNCEAEVPMVRKPGSIKEALWGGLTCPKCGTAMDKWGRRASS